ncbi:MAG: hypothetical protein HY460_01305 [Parcubacteria group bacterium]|nr:hypothetical protein [Parcubacteria group bacterium]
MTKPENIRELLRYCEAKGLLITRKDLASRKPRELQVARRAACFHGVMPRLIRDILAEKRAVRKPVATPRIQNPVAPRLDWGLRAANDHSFD